MNSFFASVEQHLRPELRGRPVGVIPVDSEGTSLIAVSVEAKARGVKTGTGVRDARRLCPDIRLLKARPPEYVRVHQAISNSIERCAPIHKAYSIDEWMLRLGKEEQDPGAAMALGQRIKASILKDFSPVIRCSIGIAPSRLLAKIGSDGFGRDALTVLEADDLPHRLEHLSLGDLCGIGSGMAARLERKGIREIRDLWSLSRAQSIEIWGSVAGAHWWAGFHGLDEPEMPTRKHSMSRANVLEPRLRHEAGARGVLTRLVCQLGARLRAEGYVTGGLSISVSDLDHRHFSASMELPLVDDTPSLLTAFGKLWDRRGTSPIRPIKVAVTVSGLALLAQVGENLFEESKRSVRLSHAMDSINQRLGEMSIYVGGMHESRFQMDDKIAFGRIPSLAPQPTSALASGPKGMQSTRRRAAPDREALWP